MEISYMDEMWINYVALLRTLEKQLQLWYIITIAIISLGL